MGISGPQFEKHVFILLLRLATDTTAYTNSFSLFLLSINVLEQPSNVYKMQA